MGGRMHGEEDSRTIAQLRKHLLPFITRKYMSYYYSYYGLNARIDMTLAISQKIQIQTQNLHGGRQSVLGES